jgi:TP53 regulating kinase and related kinases
MLMEWVEGYTVRDVLERRKRGGEREATGLMGKIGMAIGRMHEVGIVHGDLTTSNLMVRECSKEETAAAGEIETRDEGEIVLIDFGLAGQSIQEEDKAVDLYVLERAFGSTHPEAEDEFKEVLRVYGESYQGAMVVLKRLEEVRMRGRKRSMVG